MTELKSFVTQEEIKHLIRLAEERFKRSTTVESKEDPNRTSYSAFLVKSEDEVVRRIERRVCDLTNISLDMLEPFQVVRYSKNQQYRPHHDYFQNIQPTDSQRTVSIFVYLQSVPDDCGGGTIFPKLKMRFKPDSGDALMWSNVKDDNNTPDESTLHGGEPVTCDEIKYGLNIWFRSQKW